MVVAAQMFIVYSVCIMCIVLFYIYFQEMLQVTEQRTTVLNVLMCPLDV